MSLNFRQRREPLTKCLHTPANPKENLESHEKKSGDSTKNSEILVVFTILARKSGNFGQMAR